MENQRVTTLTEEEMLNRHFDLRLDRRMLNELIKVGVLPPYHKIEDGKHFWSLRDVEESERNGWLEHLGDQIRMIRDAKGW